MIVVISDLHLQHTKHDRVRRDEASKVLETRIVRNVEAGALSLLFSEIVQNARRSGAREVHLVFAGDIFELHRTPLWFVNGEPLRPTQPPSLELEAKAREILRAIESDNQDFFAKLRAFVEGGVAVYRGERRELTDSVRVVPHYIPGNHDRLLQLWPSTRRRVRELLCVSRPDGDFEAPFPHQLQWDRAAGYGVRIRHGHEYDSANFAGRFDPRRPAGDEIYGQPVLGDFVTLEIATRLAVAFRVFHAVELRTPGLAGDRYRRIYAALTEFDDVRPQSMLVRYLSDYLGATEAQTFELLRPALRDVIETSRNDAFFVRQAAGFAHGLFAPAVELIQWIVESGSAEHVARLISLIESLTREDTAAGPATHAKTEPGLDTGDIFLVIAGHTHQPDHVALPGQRAPGRAGGEAYYLDTGTWRTRLDAGVDGAFGRLRGYTMVFCYHDRELGSSDQRRFEAWTGHLMAEDFGPMFSVDVTAEARPSGASRKQRVRFLRYRVERVDEGSTRGGAELTLNFGIDGVARRVRCDHVHDEDVVAIDEELLADPALDGEVWCHGVERDRRVLGDADDALPWAFAFLERTSDASGAAFRAGPLRLKARDNRGRYALDIEVLEAVDSLDE